MKISRLLSTLPLVLNACADESPTDVSQNSAGEGIWYGAFSAGAISSSTSASGAVSTFEATESSGVGLYTSDARVFFYNENEKLLFSNDTPGIIDANLYYYPDYYDASNNNAGSLSFAGNAYTYTSIAGAYSGAVNGNYVMLFDDSYFRGADLNRLQGLWQYSHAIGDWQFSILADGHFTATLSTMFSCQISGEFATIDSTKNEYAIDNVTLLNCGGFDGHYTGLAATLDSTQTVISNDTLLMAIYNQSHGFFLKPVRQ
ncbi:MAG: hypothetical protein OEY11_02480 [Gammaproteobacteria bacterium]|nr:hypothetical protein [Gammaproteobacteria bacterium]